MPITQTIKLILPSYEEIRVNTAFTMRDASDVGLAFVAHFEEQGARAMSTEKQYVYKREALLQARAKWSLLRERNSAAREYVAAYNAEA